MKKKEKSSKINGWKFKALICTIFIMQFLISMPTHAQLFENGDFETGDFTGWTVSGPMPTIHYANVTQHQGSYSGHIHIGSGCPSGGSPPNAQWQMVGQSVFIPGVADTLSFYMSVSGLVYHDGGSVWIMDADSVGTYTRLFYTGGGGGSATNYPWEFHEVNIEPWAGREATIYFAGQNSNGCSDHLCDIYFDNVSVSPTVLDPIPPTVTVDVPNGGEEWMVGETYQIEWTADDNIGIVADRVYYSTNNGTSWNTIASHMGNSQTCEWTIPGVPSTECLIKVLVYDGGNNTAEDVSDNVFTIVANPDQVFVNGDFETGEFTGWTVTGPHSANVTQYQGSYSGHINIGAHYPSGGSPPNDQWQMVGQYVFIPGVADTLSFYMSVSGLNWHGGGSVWIMDADSLGNYTRLYHSGGGNGIGQDYPWEYHQVNIEPWAGREVTIYFAGHNSNGNYDHPCDIYFDNIRIFPMITDPIPPTVTVDAPNGGEVLIVGETYQIQWTADDNTGIVADKFYYSTNNGVSWNLIASHTGNLQTCEWIIPYVTSEFCMIKVVVYDGGNNTAFDVSDNVFTIVRDPDQIFINADFETGEFTGWTVTGPYSANVTQHQGSYSGHIHIGSNYSSGGSPPNDQWQMVGQSVFIPEVADTLSFYMSVSGLSCHSGGYVWIMDADSVGTYTRLYRTGGGGFTFQSYPWEYHQINIEPWAGREATIYFAGQNPSAYGYGAHQCDIYFDNVSVSPTVLDTIPPTVTVDVPNGGEEWMVGETYQIEWTADDNTGIVADMVYYSTNNGASWDTIAPHMGNPQTCEWTIPDVPSMECLVKVLVYDGGNNTAEDVSDAVFTIDTETDIDEPDIPEITKSRLYQNYPNPFNTETTITFSLPENTGNSELSIYNIAGQKVITLINKELSAGKHSIIWKGKDKNNKRVPTGIYYYKIKTGKFTETKKMILRT